MAKTGRPRVYDQFLAEVLELYSEGLSIRAIAKALDIPKTTVHRMVKREQ